MTYDEIRHAWNAQADDGNRWHSLSEGEKIEWAAIHAAAKVQRVPLSDEQIAEACGCKAGLGWKPLPRELQIARAIEAAHGITQEKQL